VIRITRLGARRSGSPDDRDRLREEFERRHCVRLPGLLDPDLLQAVQREVERAAFYERVHEGIGANRELCMAHGTADGLLHVLLNAPELFRVIEEVTGCDPVGCFIGRVYRMVPGAGHHDAWHDDVGDRRLVAMSLNLSTATYSGGLLQLRDRESGRLLHEVANVGSGDAIVFRLAPHLQHRVSLVEGTVPKTAFAGWFKGAPQFAAILASGVTRRRGT
jgi:hypothetical protein